MTYIVIFSKDYECGLASNDLIFKINANSEEKAFEIAEEYSEKNNFENASLDVFCIDDLGEIES